ncbi:MAG: homocysteine S-methyltransferase family protein [Ktedonobacteraceae bacterium]
MSKSRHLQQRLEQREIIVMDGAMGTEILHRGVPTTLPLWSAEALLTHPEIVQQIHEDYIAAGAEIIITNTFRTTRRAFAKRDLTDKAHDATIVACQLVQQAIKRVQPEHEVYIAGSMAPLEDCYSPELTPPIQDLLQEHYAYAQNLKTGGVDFLLLETMITSRETLAAIQAAKQLALPFGVSFCTNARGELLGGEPLEQVVNEVEKYDPLFLGVNCVAPTIATTTLRALKHITKRPLSVYAQGGGAPDDDQGWQFVEENTINSYMTHVEHWLEEGAQIIGGCCGTDPAYIERLRGPGHRSCQS